MLRNKRLKLLNLRCCKLDTAVATRTIAGLEHNNSLQLEELYLSENSQLAASDCQAVDCAMERILRVNTWLKESNLFVSDVDLTLQ